MNVQFITSTRNAFPVGVAVGGGFTPPQQSSLISWLQSDIGVTTNDSNQVTGWQPRFGSKAIVSTSENPTLNPTALRGKASIEFNSSTCLNFIHQSSVSEFTFMLATRITGTGGNMLGGLAPNQFNLEASNFNPSVFFSSPDGTLSVTPQRTDFMVIAVTAKLGGNIKSYMNNVLMGEIPCTIDPKDYQFKFLNKGQFGGNAAQMVGCFAFYDKELTAAELSLNYNEIQAVFPA